MLLRIDPESKVKEQGITERQLAASFVHLQNFLDSAWSFLLAFFIWVETHWDYNLSVQDDLS